MSNVKSLKYKISDKEIDIILKSRGCCGPQSWNFVNVDEVVASGVLSPFPRPECPNWSDPNWWKMGSTSSESVNENPGMCGAPVNVTSHFKFNILKTGNVKLYFKYDYVKKIAENLEAAKQSGECYDITIE